MKVNDPNVSSLGSAGATRTQEAERTGKDARLVNARNASAAPSDDVHLSELVRHLRALAANSPDRQAQIEAQARAYANGTYKVNAEATASKIIDDAIEY